MQFPASSFISTPSHPSSISMETNQLFPCESFSYSLRLSFDAESFIEFDPKLMSMRWSIKAQEGESSDSSLDLDSLLLPSLSLDSTKSLLSRSNRYAVPSEPVSAQSKQSRGVSKNHGVCLSCKKFFGFVLMKFCRRMKGLRLSRRRVAEKSSTEVASSKRGRGKRVFDVDAASSIQDAVLHCKNSNLSSLVEGVCKSPVLI